MNCNSLAGASKSKPIEGPLVVMSSVRSAPKRGEVSLTRGSGGPGPSARAPGGPPAKGVPAGVAAGMIRPAAPHASKVGGPAVETAPPSGSWNVPVLLVDFPDRHATYPASNFARMLFDSTGAVPTGSVADYYK